MLKLYNTLTRKKETFKPIEEGKVKIYTCGPTVYWYQHIGNLRSYFFPDILKRVLRVQGFEVKHVINVTDVGHLTSDSDEGEDKMEEASRKEKKSAKEIAEHYLEKFKLDLKKMKILEPDFWPKASEHIKEQIDLIEKLEKKGYIYKTSDGIYFDTSKFKDYGKLSKIKVEGMKAGKRVSVGEKKNKTDFALWKFSKEPGKRQQEWNSPWRVGFPGWHIECSAMSMKYLGESLDIHTGGKEHSQIHHQNEIAQSEAATGKKFANYWLHGEWLTFKGEKISKSSGGLYTLSELEKEGYSPLELRYLFLPTHYKKPLEFSFESLDYAKNSLKKLRGIISELDKTKKANKKNVEMAWKQFLEYLNDDLNTPKALSYTWDILRDERLNDTEKYEIVLKFDEVFGLDLDREEVFEIPEEIKKLAEEREKFRREKKFKEADEIRDKIKEKGFLIEDKDDGFVLKKI